MKRLLIIVLAIMVMVSSGCYSEKHVNESSVSESSAITTIEQEKTDTSQMESSNAENLPTNEERRNENETLAQENVSSETNTSTLTESKAETEKNEPETTVSTTTSIPQNAEKQEPENITPSVSETSTSESKPSEPTKPQASANDVKMIAKKVAEHLNQYRADQGVSPATVLPGLTEYAEYRSRQLVSNFAHDTFDERAAATALKYGEYVDPPLYGMTGEPYYEANVREAIAKAGYSGSVENVAENIAQLVRNSSAHWNYVGSGEYSFIAVGITYKNDMWYCDIAVSRENTDN